MVRLLTYRIQDLTRSLQFFFFSFSCPSKMLVPFSLPLLQSQCLGQPPDASRCHSPKRASRDTHTHTRTHHTHTHTHTCTAQHRIARVRVFIVHDTHARTHTYAHAVLYVLFLGVVAPERSKVEPDGGNKVAHNYPQPDRVCPYKCRYFTPSRVFSTYCHADLTPKTLPSPSSSQLLLQATKTRV